MSSATLPANGPVLVLGATGYVGGRLVPGLLEKGCQVRAGVRSPAKLSCRSYGMDAGLEIAPADAADYQSLVQAMQSCQAVYYLVPSMQSGGRDFAAADILAARNTAQAAAASGVQRIICLVCPGQGSGYRSAALRSRREALRILQQGTVPVTCLRASVILGAGSASFELLRYLVERLPVMLTPRWIHTAIQPIAIRNVLTYLIGCLEIKATSGRTFDIGGPEVLTYKALFELYAEEARLPRRFLVPVPVFLPRLSACWVHLLTPVPASLARPLVEGLRSSHVCEDEHIRDLIPQRLLSAREAIRTALGRIRHSGVETCWSDAGQLNPPEWIACGDPAYAGGSVLRCDHRIVVKAGLEELWPKILAIGGDNGWYYADWLWRLRGALDRLAGGSGLRRGRRDPRQLRVGDALDFWRVLEIEPEKRLKLLAEMRFPGEAYLEFQLRPRGRNGVEIRQLSRFVPQGMAGMIYWYALAPVHRLIFRGMLKNFALSTRKKILRGPERLLESESEACTRPGLR